MTTLGEKSRLGEMIQLTEAVSLPIPASAAPIGLWQTLGMLVRVLPAEKTELQDRFLSLLQPGVDYEIAPYRLLAAIWRPFRRYHAGVGMTQRAKEFDAIIRRLETGTLEELQVLPPFFRRDCQCGTATRALLLGGANPTTTVKSVFDRMLALVRDADLYEDLTSKEFWVLTRNELFRVMEEACNTRPLFAVEFPSVS